jgi:hypothetical protein
MWEGEKRTVLDSPVNPAVKRPPNNNTSRSRYIWYSCLLIQQMVREKMFSQSSFIRFRLYATFENVGRSNEASYYESAS